jgi:hypothetical protein
MGLRKASQAGKTIFHFSENIFEQPAHNAHVESAGFPKQRIDEEIATPRVLRGPASQPSARLPCKQHYTQRTTSSFPLALSARFSEQYMCDDGPTCDG